MPSFVLRSIFGPWKRKRRKRNRRLCSGRGDGNAKIESLSRWEISVDDVLDVTLSGEKLWLSILLFLLMFLRHHRKVLLYFGYLLLSSFHISLFSLRNFWMSSTTTASFTPCHPGWKCTRAWVRTSALPTCWANRVGNQTSHVSSYKQAEFSEARDTSHPPLI